MNIASLASGAITYHVALPPLGADGNPGTEALPFGSINKAASVARAGDTVLIHAGTYQPDSEISPAHSGKQGEPVTFRAMAGKEVIIDGRLKLPLEKSRKMGVISIENRSWIVIDGIHLLNSRWAGVLVRNSDNIIIENCNTENTHASGIIAANSRSIKVLHNTVQKACVEPGNPRVSTDECITMASVDEFEVAHNTVSDRMHDTNDGGEGIDVKNACRNGMVHHNHVYDLIRLGIYCDAYSKLLENVSIFANTVHGCRKGIVVACEEGGTARGVSIHDNLIYDCPRIGIQIAGYLKGGPIQDLSVYQNTVVRCGLGKEKGERAGLMIDAGNPANRNYNIRNNILSGNFNQLVTRKQDYLTIECNLLHGSSSDSGVDVLEEDPRFVNSVANDFSLMSDSPAIDVAIGEPLSTVDHSGRARPVAGPKNSAARGDLGAFEWALSDSFK